MWIVDGWGIPPEMGGWAVNDGIISSPAVVPSIGCQTADSRRRHGAMGSARCSNDRLISQLPGMPSVSSGHVLSEVRRTKRVLAAMMIGLVCRVVDCAIESP